MPYTIALKTDDWINDMMKMDRADTARENRTRPGSEKAAVTPRSCLACGQTFDSEGAHNRLCLQCRKRT
jgi:hypothetical protein